MAFNFRAEVDRLLGRQPRDPARFLDMLSVPRPASPPDFLEFAGQQFDPAEIMPGEAAAVTAETLPGAKPDDAGGFSATDALFDLLDVPGALVRGVVGAGTALAQGKGEEAGKRVLGGLPGSEMVLGGIFGANEGKGYSAPSGSEILEDLGWKQGSTAEDERRVRIAVAGGMTETEARRRFGTLGEKRPDSTTQKELDDLLKAAQDKNPEFDAGVSFDDWKKAADAQDVAGLALEIALDPTTYMSLGASAAGKAARAVSMAGKAAPKLTAALRGVKTASAARKIIEGTAELGARQKGRLVKLVEEAFAKGPVNLELGRTAAEKAARGQFGINFMGRQVGGRSLAEAATVIGQSDLARGIEGLDNAGVREGTRQAMEEGILKYPTKAARAVTQFMRERFSNRTGVQELDDLIAGSRAAGRETLVSGSRELNRLEREIEKIAKTRGEDLNAVRARVADAVERLKGAPESEQAAKLAAEMGKVLPEEQIGAVAAGIARLNKQVLDAAQAAGTGLVALSDESLGYLKRQMTPEGREWLKNNGRKFHKLTGGLEFDVRTPGRKGRTEAWRGMTITEINKLMEPEVGEGKKFFYEDPVFATRAMLRENHRAISNAKTVTGVIERFGDAAPDGYKGKTALNLYELVGMKAEGAEAERLGKLAIDRELYEFMTRMTEWQKAPSGFMKAWQTALGWMKASVTLPFPAFHGRNLLENGFKSLAEGNLDPANFKNAGRFLAEAADVNAGGHTVVDKAARKAQRAFKDALGGANAETRALLKEAGFDDLKQAFDWMDAHGVLENKISSELGTILNGNQEKAAGLKREAAALIGSPIRAGFAVSSGTENLFRVSMFLDRLRKGFGREEALAEVQRVFFDFRDLTNWESGFARNLGFFYNFYRNNIRYIVAKAAEDPQLSKQLVGLMRDDPDDPRSRWLSKKAMVSVAGQDLALGFLPQQQFNMFDLEEGDLWDKLGGVVKGAAGQLNPLIVGGLEAGFDTDLYSNQPLEWRDRAGDWSFLPEDLQARMGLQQTTAGEWRIDPTVNAWLNVIPALGRALQTAVVLDDTDRSALEKGLQLLTGVRLQGDEEPEKGSLDLLSRNIDREGKRLNDKERLLRQDGRGSWVVDSRTVRGRQLAALASPSSLELQHLPEHVVLEIAPLLTFDRDGSPRMNRAVRDRLDKALLREFPEHAALLGAVALRRKAQLNSREPLPADVSAAESFDALLKTFGR